MLLFLALIWRILTEGGLCRGEELSFEIIECKEIFHAFNIYPNNDLFIFMTLSFPIVGAKGRYSKGAWVQFESGWRNKDRIQIKRSFWLDSTKITNHIWYSPFSQVSQESEHCCLGHLGRRSLGVTEPRVRTSAWYSFLQRVTSFTFPINRACGLYMHFGVMVAVCLAGLLNNFILRDYLENIFESSPTSLVLYMSQVFRNQGEIRSYWVKLLPCSA